MRSSDALEQKNIQDLLKQIETCKSVSDVRVLKPRLLFVNGLVKEVSLPDTIRKDSFMGQYGNIVSVTVTKARQNFYSAFVEYSKEAQAALALLSLDNFLYKGKIVRVFYGSTKYCFSFLKGQQCKIRQCSFSHKYEKSFTYFKANTSSIDHLKIAERVLKTDTSSLFPRAVHSPKFPQPFKKLQSLRAQIQPTGNNLTLEGTILQQQWDSLQKQINSFVVNQVKVETKRKTKVQQFLEYAEEKLYSLIFKSGGADPDSDD